MIDQKTINSLKRNQEELELGGPIKTNLDELIAAIAATRTEKITLSSMKPFVAKIYETLALNPNIKKIIIKDLEPEVLQALIFYLEKRTSPITIAAENLDEDSINILCEQNQPNLNLSLTSGDWTFTYKLNESTKEIKFLFKNDTIIHFKLDGFHLEKSEISDLITSIPPPVNLPLEQLTSELWRKMLTTKDIEICEDIALNYFSGPIPDFLNYQLDHSLTLETFYLGDFSDEIINILRNEGIIVCENPFDGEDYWLRDIFKCFGNGMYQINAGALDETHFNLSGNLLVSDPNSMLAKSTLPIAANFMGSSGNEDIKKEGLENILMENHIPYEAKELSEGGNLITLKKDGKIFIIIGENSKILETVFRAQNKLADPNVLKFFDEQSAKKDKAYYQDLAKESDNLVRRASIKEAKSALANALRVNPDQIIWIPNPAYHIDLMLTSLNGCVLLNNFSLTAKILANSPDPKDHKLAQHTKDLDAIYSPMLNKIKEQLEAKGIKVIDVPGVVCTKNDSDEYVSIANFMNAYTGKGKNGNFFMTLASENNVISQAFQKILKEEGIENVYFVGKDQGKFLGDTLLNSYRGSLRCLSTSGNIFGRLNTLPPSSDDLHSDHLHDDDDNLHDDEYESSNSESKGKQSDYDDKAYRTNSLFRSPPTSPSLLSPPCTYVSKRRKNSTTF